MPQNHTKTITAATCGGTAALLAVNAALGSPTWAIAVLAVLLLPSIIWGTIVCTGHAATR